MPPMSVTVHTDTRRQLAAMRVRLVSNLGEQIEGGNLALLAAVNGALSAIEAVDAAIPDAEAAARAVVTDTLDGPIALTLYNEAEAVATIALPPIRALALAGELIRAALPRVREPA
jgi:hypothetical protein